MAPTFRPGKGAAILVNNVNLSQVTNEVTVEGTAAALKTTVFGVNDETYIPGVRAGTFTIAGLFDGTILSTALPGSTGAIDEKIAGALGSTAAQIITYGPEGTTFGNRARMFKSVHTKATIQSPAADVVKFAADGQIQDRQDYGVWLHPLRAQTSTSSTFANVNSGIAAGTTLGGVAHFHMTSDTTVATFRVKVQHSSSATAWADLITFSSSTGVKSAGAAQRSTVSGTVKRYTRCIIGTFTGGSSKSATFAVAFARRNLPK